MSTYTIGETSERSGFSASALRYYEGIGLVTPAARTDAGYRVYDDAVLARLAFIARAKALGCTLDEITDLVGIWDGERCGPVQRRFHDLVTDKIRTSQDQIASLVSFVSQLRAAAGQLSRPPIDGPCDDTCACFAAEPGVGPAIACSLDPGALTDQLAAWQAILAYARSRSLAPPGGLRILFDNAVDVSELARLAAAEQRCCSFFSFTITIDARDPVLEVRAPAEAEHLVAALFGPPT